VAWRWTGGIVASGLLFDLLWRHCIGLILDPKAMIVDVERHGTINAGLSHELGVAYRETSEIFHDQHAVAAQFGKYGGNVNLRLTGEIIFYPLHAPALRTVVQLLQRTVAEFGHGALGTDSSVNSLLLLGHARQGSQTIEIGDGILLAPDIKVGSEMPVPAAQSITAALVGFAAVAAWWYAGGRTAAGGSR
jgi:hypothetical protein